MDSNKRSDDNMAKTEPGKQNPAALHLMSEATVGICRVSVDSIAFPLCLLYNMGPLSWLAPPHACRDAWEMVHILSTSSMLGYSLEPKLQFIAS